MGKKGLIIFTLLFVSVFCHWKIPLFAAIPEGKIEISSTETFIAENSKRPSKKVRQDRVQRSIASVDEDGNSQNKIISYLVILLLPLLIGLWLIKKNGYSK